MRYCLYIIKFQIMPWEADMLPVDVDDWLMPVAMCLTQIQNEASNAASRKATAAYAPGGMNQHRDDT